MNDIKALKILFSKYWSPSEGWQKNEVSEEDFEYAKNAGVMFDELILDHDGAVQKCIKECNSIEKSIVAKAFVSSLSSRRLDIRSGLSSYVCGEKLPLHKYMQDDNNSHSKSCMFCTESKNNNPIDLNVLNFERHKFGGVRHLQPSYIWFDLMLLSKENIEEPTKEDVDILNGIFIALSQISSNTLSGADKALKAVLRGNKNEREGIVAALGYCGVLKIPDYNPMHQRYIPFHDRKHSNYSKSDWPFPSDLWRPDFGLDQESINYWFGPHIS